MSRWQFWQRAFRVIALVLIIVTLPLFARDAHSVASSSYAIYLPLVSKQTMPPIVFVSRQIMLQGSSAGMCLRAWRVLAHIAACCGGAGSDDQSLVGTRFALCERPHRLVRDERRRAVLAERCESNQRAVGDVDLPGAGLGAVGASLPSAQHAQHRSSSASGDGAPLQR